MITSEILTNSKLQQGSTADNAVASVTVAAVQGQRHFVCSIDADYSAAVALFKTVTLKVGTTTVFIWRWDFSKGPFQRNLAVPHHGEINQAVSVELEASGTAGITGRAGVGVATI